LAKQIIVDSQGKIVEHELNSPFVYLHALVQNVSASRNGKGESKQPNQGAYKMDKTGQNSENVEEFVAGLRFEQRGKLDLVPIKLCLSESFIRVGT
jgi:hypothetical protein